MKDMDKYWKNVDSLFDSKDTRKVGKLCFWFGIGCCFHIQVIP